VVRVGVVGASGYVGGELLRLLLGHPEVELTVATSRQYRGEYIYRVHPNLRGFTDLQFSDPNIDELTDRCDLVFTAVPHGRAVELVPSLVAVGMRVIDMSADFRLKDPADYVKYYGFEHPHPELLERFIYGVPELHREELKGAKWASAPGCMAVTTILGLAPLVRERLVDLDHLVVDAMIGSSGAGITPTPASHHPERFGVVRPYEVVGHRHTGEIVQELSRLAGRRVRVAFTPHAVNMVRGILCTAHGFTGREVGLAELWRAYRAMYGGEPFVRLVKDRRGLHRLPNPKTVIGSNFCDVGFDADPENRRVVAFSATDNLGKGAAGSGVQVMNVMLGFDERAGLHIPSPYPL
jgi:N-acetyl-gamma-glutamyl-phosphate/LysW-gamma-L-alpha-aminoadipyl-6-phosphate reductase